MRIAHFTSSFLPVVDGVGRVVHSYAEQMAKMGHECYVVAPMADTGYRGGYPFELIDYYSRPLPKMPQYKTGVPLLDTHYHARMNMVKLDIIHIHDPFTTGREGIRLAKKRDIPVVGTFHSKLHEDFLQVTGSEVLAEVGAKLVASLYDRCDEVWAVSSSAGNTLKEYGYKGEVIVMPNGTEICPCTREDMEAACEKFSLPLEGDLLLYVGQMNWKKNIARILEVAQQLKQDGHKFTLVLAGQGLHEGEIKERVDNSGLKDCTVFTGHITDKKLLGGLYCRAQLFLFPSLYDNCPLVVREAAVQGTPAVCIKDSSTAECIKDGYNGILCRDTANDMYQAVKRWLLEPEALKKLGENAKQSIPVSWEQLTEQVLCRYQLLIDKKVAARKSATNQ